VVSFGKLGDAGKEKKDLKEVALDEVEVSEEIAQV